MLDYFEMDRVTEELAKAYPAQCATISFKITKNHKPTKEEYRDKVVEYMKQFEYLLATYPQCLETDKLKEHVRKSLDRERERCFWAIITMSKDDTNTTLRILHQNRKIFWKN